jgi:hypothetical protein
MCDVFVTVVALIGRFAGVQLHIHSDYVKDYQPNHALQDGDAVSTRRARYLLAAFPGLLSGLSLWRLKEGTPQ